MIRQIGKTGPQSGPDNKFCHFSVIVCHCAVAGMIFHVTFSTHGVNAALVLFFPRYGHILANYTRLQRRV